MFLGQLLLPLALLVCLVKQTLTADPLSSTLVTTKSFPVTTSLKFVAPHTADGRLNYATTVNAFSQSSTSSARFSSSVDQIKVAEDSGRVVYKSQDGTTFAVDNGFVYLDLNQIRDVNKVLFSFGNYVLYTPNSAPLGTYRVLNVNTGAVSSLTTPTPNFFDDYSCGDGQGQLVCVTTGTTDGQILKMETVSFQKVDLQMVLDFSTGRKITYSKIWKTAGFDSFLIIVGERTPGGSLLTVDGYFVTDANTLLLVQTITLTLTGNTYKCGGTAKPVIDINVVEGILSISCPEVPGNTTLYSAAQNVWSPTVITGFALTETTGLYFNRFSSQATISTFKDNIASLTLLTLSSGASPQRQNETITCRVYSKLFRVCTACNAGYLLSFNNATTTTSCTLNEPFIASSDFSIFSKKGYLFVNLSTLPQNESPEALKTKLEAVLSPKGDNLVFYDPNTLNVVPTSTYFDLELQLNAFDLRDKIVRYRLVTQQERGPLSVWVRFKTKDPSALGAKTSSLAGSASQPNSTSRSLQYTGSVYPQSQLLDSQVLTLPSRAGPSSDLEVLCLSLYIILCVPCQIFLVFVRPFHQEMRESFKTFWVGSLVIHLQTICLLGTLGGDLRGPLDNLFGAALKAIMKYLVFDLEFHFDSRVAEYQFVTPYDGLAFNQVNPFILQTRFLWIALYVLAYILSVIGTRRFKTKFYHMRIGIIISTLPELIYFSISTMFTCGYLQIYNTFTTFSLLVSIATLIVIILEFMYIQLCSFKNLKFMLMFDMSRNFVDEYKFSAAEFLKVYSDYFFAVLASASIGLISQRVDILGRLFIGIGVVYILLNISKLTTTKPDFHKINHQLKLLYGGLWILLMICVIELYSNLALGKRGINGLSYFAMVIIMLMLIVLATIVVYRVFKPETPTGTEKPEANYKTNYVLRTYKRARGKEGTVVATNPNATTILADETFLSRTAAKLPPGGEPSVLKGSGITPTSSALASMRRTTSKQKDQSNLGGGGPSSPVLRYNNSGSSNNPGFRIAELASVGNYSQQGSRPPSERAGRAEKPSGGLLDKFSSGILPDEPRDSYRGKRGNATSNPISGNGSAKNSARGNGFAFKVGPGDDDHSAKDPSPIRQLDQIFNRGGNQERRSDPVRENPVSGSNWFVSDPKASMNNLYQIKESRIEDASQLADLSYDINLAINDPNANLLRKKSLRELMNEDSDKKVREKSDPPQNAGPEGVGVEGHPNRAAFSDTITTSAKTSQVTRPTPIGIQDLEIPPEN